MPGLFGYRKRRSPTNGVSVDMTWAGRNVERRITDAMVKKKLWVQLLVKCWTIEHGQKVVGL